MNSIQYIMASDHSLLVTIGSEISEECHLNVHRLTRLLLEHRHEAIKNIHPAYSSILITFDPLRISLDDVQSFTQSLATQLKSITLPESRVVEIPVCYGAEFGPDLYDVASHNSLKPDEVISIHSSRSYLVYFLGFSPGFPYLGGMDPRIATPRLTMPRRKVPAGSVAIAGNQTGIYPVSSPGGWRLIGRTPLKLFEPQEDSPTLLSMGDQVRFSPISQDEFHQLVT